MSTSCGLYLAIYMLLSEVSHFRLSDAVCEGSSTTNFNFHMLSHTFTTRLLKFQEILIIAFPEPQRPGKYTPASLRVTFQKPGLNNIF
jgi:hypothetical protein